MEISIPRFLSQIPNHSSFVPNPPFRHHSVVLSPKKNPTSLKKPGGIHFVSPLPRASTSEETNTSASSASNQFNKLPDEAIRADLYFERAPDEATKIDSQSEKAEGEAIEVEVQTEKTADEARSIDARFDKPLDEAINTECPLEEASDEPIKNGAASDEVITAEETSKATSVAVQKEVLEVLDELDIKQDYSDPFSIFIDGVVVLLAFWILSAIVGAIKSIPLFPKVLEIIGLAYSVWFSYRYLIFKKSREELLMKIEELKKQIIGPTDA